MTLTILAVFKRKGKIFVKIQIYLTFQNKARQSICIFLQIKVVADLPVGENLQDHVVTLATTFTLDAPISITKDKENSLFSYFQYQLFGTGD